jgi:hypothetical protein
VIRSISSPKTTCQLIAGTLLTRRQVAVPGSHVLAAAD